MKKALCFKQGSFSFVNESIARTLPAALPGYEFRWFDIIDDIARRRPATYFAGLIEATLRYPQPIFRYRFSPQAFLPRTVTFLRMFEHWVATSEAFSGAAFSFQTQSVFRAIRPGIPHFGYTDHTHLANARYGSGRKLQPMTRQWLAMERSLYADSRVTFTTGEFAARSVVEDYNIPSSRVECVHSGINIAFPEMLPARANPYPRIVFVGVEWERKGGPEMIEAFRKITAEFPQTELHIVGCDPGLSMDRVVIHGRIPREQVGEHLAQADIFLMPSRSEPSAVAVVEAAAYGLPVVTTSVGANAERVLEGESGFLVSPRDPGAIAGALRKLLSDAALRQRFGERGRALVKEHFLWETVAEKIARRIRAELVV